MKSVLGELDRNDLFSFRGSKNNAIYRVTLNTNGFIYYKSIKNGRSYKMDLNKIHNYSGSYTESYNRSIILKSKKMKKARLVLFMGLMSVLSFSSCEKEVDSNNTNNNGGNCGWYNDKPTYKGPNGGCYYINSNGNKTYVDAQYCPC